MTIKLLLKKIWNELASQISKEQSFSIFLYFSFLSYLKNIGMGAQLKNVNYNNLQTLKQLQEIFKDTNNTDLKKSVKEFEENIDWEMLSSNSICEKCIRTLNHIFKELIKDIDSLETVISVLEELASQLDNLVFTPPSVNHLIAAMPVAKKIDSIAELYCGLSGTGLTLFQRLFSQNSNLLLTGEEQRKPYCNISRLRMFCHGIISPNVIQHDILQAECDKMYDLVIADLPKGNNETIDVSSQKNFIENKNKIFVEWAAIQKILHRVRPNGMAMIIVTKGALVRQLEQDIRMVLTDYDWLEAVITLPSNLYASTSLGFELLIFNKEKKDAYKEKVFFADISKKENWKNGLYKISQNTIECLKKAYENLEEHTQFSTVVSLKKIKENNFSWNPFLYLQLKQANAKNLNTFRLKDIADIMRGVQISKADEEQLSHQATHYWLNIRNIGDHTIFFDPQSMLRPRSADWEEKFGIQEGDIILTSKGSLLKICMIEPGMPKAFLCGNLTRIRVNNHLYSPYVLYEFLTSKEGLNILKSIQSGTTIKVLNNTNLKEIPIPAYKNVKEKGKQLQQLYQNYWAAKKKLRDDFDTQRKKLLEEL